MAISVSMRGRKIDIRMGRPISGEADAVWQHGVGWGAAQVLQQRDRNNFGRQQVIFGQHVGAGQQVTTGAGAGAQQGAATTVQQGVGAGAHAVQQAGWQHAG
jgi:hypothetical protein